MDTIIEIIKAYLPVFLLIIMIGVLIDYLVNRSVRLMRKLCPSDQDRYDAFQKVIEKGRKEHPEWKFNFSAKATRWGNMKYKLEVVKSNGETDIIE